MTPTSAMKVPTISSWLMLTCACSTSVGFSPPTMLVDRGHAWKGTNGVASRSQWRVVGENTHFDGRTRPWGLWQARRTRRGGKGGICGMLVMGEKEEIERLKFEASQERSRASMKGAEERAKKELLRREIEELERSKEAVVSKVRDFFDKIQSDPRLAKASAGSSPDALIAKNPEFQKCVKRIDELQSELDKLMLWGATSLSAREGSSEAAKELARELKQRPVLVLPDGVLGEHLATAAKEERFLSKEELKEIEADLPFAGREWKQTEEGARLRKIMANMLREFEGTIVEAARDRIPAEFPGIASPGQPLHSKDVTDAVFEELYHSLRICQYATATGAPSFTDPEASATLRALLREHGVPPVVLAQSVRAMQRRASFLGKMSREAPDCWPACVPAFERCAEVFEDP